MTGVRFHHITRQHGVNARHVFGQRHHGDNIERELQRFDDFHQPEHHGSTTHIVFHGAHSFAFFQPHPAGIEGNAFADKRVIRCVFSATLPAQRYQSGRVVAAFSCGIKTT
ncbi:hypothetical protein D3C75_744480 [compost metagenome]